MECPKCGHHLKSYKNPLPTVDIIIETKGGIVLIERKNKPFGWALPGGFVDYGESLEQAAVREALEETGLQIDLKQQLKTYSAPDRGGRFCCIKMSALEASSPARRDPSAVAIKTVEIV